MQMEVNARVAMISFDVNNIFNPAFTMSVDFNSIQFCLLQLKIGYFAAVFLNCTMVSNYCGFHPVCNNNKDISEISQVSAGY